MFMMGRRIKMARLATELPDRKEFTKLHTSRATVPQLADKYFVSESTINRWIKIYGLENKLGKYILKEELERLFNIYPDSYYIAKRLGVDHQTVNKYLIQYKLIQRVVGHKIKLVDIKELYELRINQKWTFKALGKHFNVSLRTIQNRCEENEFPPVKAENMRNKWKLGNKVTGSRREYEI